MHPAKDACNDLAHMRKYLYLGYDLFCISVSLVLALYLRHGFPLIQEGQPHDLYLLLGTTLLTGIIILPLMHTHTSMWRFTSSSELRSIIIAVGLVVLFYNSSLFLISRLDMMPRSVPPMHWALAVTMMGGTRLLVRQLYGPASPKHRALKQHVLVVGACHTAELYMEFTKRIVQHHVVVEGFVDSDRTLTNWLFQKRKILGTPNDIPQIIEQLLVHGIHIKQVILAQFMDELQPSERETLERLEKNGLVDLVHFAKDMAPHFHHRGPARTDYYQQIHDLPAAAYAHRAGYYIYAKRGFDVLIGLALLVPCLPLMALTSIIVALDVGMPLLFWQQRPGMHGKAFRLYKFRTMRHARRRMDEDRLAHKSGDGLRTSWVGKWLRRLRMDELPQLFHIIAGTMSFVGPRPLLPDDQPVGGQARLSVRPGVTGWAQIHGGDALTPEEKLVLDLWYIHHMSLWLDVKIILRTLLVVLKPDMRHIHLAAPTTDVAAKGMAAHE